MSVDLGRLLDRAEETLNACRGAGSNPGLELGLALGNAWQEGHDKVVFPFENGLGLWLEQLLAESTGKEGRGLVPAPGERPDYPDRQAQSVELGDPYDLGSEFFRWEFATAVAGAILEINPFDQPNVQEAKDRTVAILDGFGRDGKLPAEEPGSLSDVLRQAERGRSYVCLQAFVAPTPERQALLAHLQGRLRDGLGCAVTAGFGPRYLHSTGQYHKGGPPTGIFVQLLASEQDDEAIPGRAFGFRTLRDAQALGDAGALRRRGLPVARIPMAACEAAIERALEHIANLRITT
jgi:hypothetical protein